MNGKTMSNLKLIDRVTLGCEPYDEPPDPSNSHIVRFCRGTAYAWGCLVPWLSEPFIKAQLAFQEGSLNKPFRCSIIYPFELDHKRKESDPETVYWRIKWIVENMLPPDCGIDIALYQNTDIKDWITAPWATNQFWSMAKRNQPKGEYITVQRIEQKIGRDKKTYIHREGPKYIQAIEEKAERYGYKIHFVDYTTPFPKMYDLLLGSDHHFSYCGSTYFFASLIGVPTTGYVKGEGIPDIFTPESYYDYHTAERIRVMTQMTKWGNLNTNYARIMQYDPKYHAVLDKPADYLREIDSIEKLDQSWERILRCRK